MADVVDHAMIFDGWMTDAEAAALLTSTSPLGGLPEPEGRLVWFAPMDGDTPNPVAGSFAGGRRATSAADSLGFTRFVAVLRNGAASVDPLALQFASSTGADFGVGLATSGTDDTVAAMHNQLAGESGQQLRVR